MDNVTYLFQDEFDDTTSPAFQKYYHALEWYMYYNEGEASEPLRSPRMPSSPWPESDNIMLEYLFQRAKEISISQGMEAAICWIGIHAWREGFIQGFLSPEVDV